MTYEGLLVARQPRLCVTGIFERARDDQGREMPELDRRKYVTREEARTDNPGARDQR